MLKYEIFLYFQIYYFFSENTFSFLWVFISLNQKLWRMSAFSKFYKFSMAQRLVV